MTIQRYKEEVNHGEAQLFPDPEGDWVLYEDVKLTLEQIEALTVVLLHYGPDSRMQCLLPLLTRGL